MYLILTFEAQTDPGICKVSFTPTYATYKYQCQNFGSLHKMNLVADFTLAALVSKLYNIGRYSE